MAEKKRVLSGMRPSGRLHLGHLQGVLENWKRLQEEFNSFFFVADWHALTSEYAASKTVTENVPEMVIDWLSVGIEPEKATLFLQSSVVEHAELHLLLSMITPLSWLERNPTYKEQMQEIKGRDLSTYGFLGYPVLQAADILIYRAETVPIGMDQLPHLELTREIARRFNFLYGKTFPVPEPILTETPKLLGFDGRKMSKSYNNVLLISDPPETIKAKILPMVTCPHRIRRKDPGHPEHCPVFTLHEVYSSKEEMDYAAEGCRTAGIGCVDCKKIVIKNINGLLEPIQQRRRGYEKQVDTVMDILKDGSERARKEARETMEIVREAIWGMR
ncbi:MAG: tryptophan--tRNA ligase [Thermodesulfobacteriota bacterium]